MPPADVLRVGARTVNGPAESGLYESQLSMPVRDPVFTPPFNVVRASPAELTVTDLGRSRAFYADCLGLLVTDETADALYLRGVEERNHHSLVLRRSHAAEARALGFKL